MRSLFALCLLAAMAPAQDAKLLREYKIPRAIAVKFGDLTGDGKTDFVVLNPDYSATAFDHDGKQLWAWQAPEEGARLRGEFEAPGLVWDLDGDGACEFLHWRSIDGKEWLVVADGRTGEVRKRVEWPTTPMPHVYNNFRIAIGRLHKGGRPDNPVVFTDSGGTISISAYRPDMTLLWRHTKQTKKDHLGHYPYPVDLNGDGVDEVVVSLMALDASGNVLWDRYDLLSDNHDHADSFRFADIDGDGKLEILTPVSDLGVMAWKASNGELLWQGPAEHAQQLEFGRFLKGVRSPQVAVNARLYGKKPGEPRLAAYVCWYDPSGKFVSRWPSEPVAGNPDFVKGDWRGDGVEELFWFKYHMKEDGAGEQYFDEPVYHMFDFTGGGADEVITLSPGLLRVYGSSAAKHGPVKRDDEYLRCRVANHTHY